MRLRWLRQGLPAVLLGLLATAGAASDGGSGPVPLQRIALGELGGWIELPVSVAGRSGRWLLDTGASRNLVSPQLAQRLNLAHGRPVRADTPLGPVQGAEVELPPLRIGTLERPAQRALVIELARVFGPAADGIEGVIGVPLLEDLQLELDLRAWSASFTTRAAADCPQDLAALPLARFRGLPVITLAVGSASEPYVLDTGNPAGLIRVEAEAPTAATPGLALPGDLRLTVLAEAALGPHLRRDVPVLRLAAAPLKRSFEGAVRGLAGTAFLEGARWRIDLARQRLCVEAGRFGTPGGFGLLFEPKGPTLTISGVLPGGPAERAGLRAGEPILRWNGLPATRPQSELWQAVQGRETLELSVGDPPRDITLRRAIFAPPAGP